MNDVSLPDLDIVRNLLVPIRADETTAVDGRLATMEVRFSVFDSWYEIDSWWEGKFLERTKRGAFKKTINESGARTKVLFNHGMDFSIGDKILGPVEALTEEQDSPVGVVPLLDTSYNRDLLPGLRAGVYGSSFMFRVVKDEWDHDPGMSEHNPEGIPERTITEVRLFEFGPVTWPANPAATSGVRCLAGTDAFYEQLRSRDPRRVDALRSRIEDLRTSRAAPAAQALADEEAAPENTDEPADLRVERHSGGTSHAARRAALFPYLKETR